LGVEGEGNGSRNLPEPTVRMFRCHPITLPFVSPHGTEQERSTALYQFSLLCGEVYDNSCCTKESRAYGKKPTFLWHRLTL